jgi:CBS domain-containing protein
MKIQDLMTSGARVCQPADNLSTAAQSMWEGDVGALPVVDADGKLVGMITDRDICMAAHLRGAPLWAVPVSEAMAKVVFSCRPEQKIEDVLALCAEKRIRRVPVVDGDSRLVGLTTLSMLAQAVDGEGKNKPGISAKDICRPLTTITSRREPQSSARLEVEVTRTTLAASDVLTPAPRSGATKSDKKADAKAEKKADKKGSKARAGK